MVCGDGERYRNLSCFVSDGSGDAVGSSVDEELCGGLEPAVDGDKRISLKEACTLPCPGNGGGLVTVVTALSQPVTIDTFSDY